MPAAISGSATAAASKGTNSHMSRRGRSGSISTGARSSLRAGGGMSVAMTVCGSLMDLFLFGTNAVFRDRFQESGCPCERNQPADNPVASCLLGRMSDKKPGVICVGEVMIELSRGNEGRYGQAFGGDTFNTAVYLARAGVPAAYATAMGDDPYSDALVALPTAEGVNTDPIIRLPGRTPGPYMIP